ncbi:MULTISPECIES: phage tail protein [unclassified Corallococcus]|uniref:phage tail protein n=1 Tax=Corallococcus TaxID=83461 RepID=UPI001CBBCA4C|nr:MULTISPECIES: phage tail protein [unclassified Corallococcus]MBZ4332981.1 phage tail protein [Corallococcus sp. AS-1-12]MBZ4373788.1 phage tail protein [Corallococcus sp. AS-1-6]
MPKVGDIWESYRANEFVLKIDGTESPGVSKISGLSEGELETIEQPDGGSNHVYKIAAAKVKFESLTIERYVDGSPEDKRFMDWFRQTFKLNSRTQGGSTVRKNGMIEKRHNGETVMTFAFFNAWVKSSKFTDLEAGTTNLMKQTIVLEHEGLERAD